MSAKNIPSPQTFMFAWVSLTHAGAFLLQGIDAAMREEFGLSIAEQDLLSQLSLRGDRLRFVDLSQRMNISKPGVTKMIDRLEKMKLVERRPSTKDRRAINAVLTKKGTALVPKTRSLLRGWVKAHFGDFLTDQEHVRLTGLLRKVLEGNNRWQVQEAQLKACR